MSTTCTHDYHWYPETNEEGWRCCMCEHRPGEPAGFSPQHDRELIGRKVDAVLTALHDADVIYVSNIEHGEHLMLTVAARCERRKRYDQYSIALFVLEEMTASHAKYWGEISSGVMSGNDTRRRCTCGKLANVFSGDKQWCGGCHSRVLNGEAF